MPIKINHFNDTLPLHSLLTKCLMTLSVGVLLALYGTAGEAVAQSQSVTELNQQQKAAERRRAELEKQINSVKRLIKSQESEKQDVVDRLSESERNISRINAELDGLQEQQEAAQHEIVLLRRQADGQRELLAERQEDLGEQIYAQYTSGLSPWSALFSGGDAQKIGRDMCYLSYVARARARAVQELNQAILSL